MLRPRYWGGHLALVVAVAAAVALGLWQYHAWGSRRAAAQRDLTNAPAVPLSSVMGGDSPFPGRSLGQPVRFAGSWLDRETLFVSGQVSGGYWVVTPVLVGHSAMPVVRGWSTTPHAPTVHGRVQVTGWLEVSDGNGPPDPNPQDTVIPALQLAVVAQHVPVDLYSGFVIAGATRPVGGAGLESVSPPANHSSSATTALRNLLYAVQWWVFGAFAVFIWARWCRDTTEKVRSGE